MKAHGFSMKGPFKGEIVSTLPEWTVDDEGREIYVEDEEKRYYADGTSWVDYSIGGIAGSSGTSGTSGSSGTSLDWTGPWDSTTTYIKVKLFYNIYQNRWATWNRKYVW